MMDRQLHAWVSAPAVLMALLMSAWMTGCAVPNKPDDKPREITTASDQTDADRRARVRLELAAAYLGRNQLSTALDEVKLAIQASPRLADAYSLRGLVYAAMDEERLADDSFRQALQLAPGDGGTLHNHAWFLCQRGRYPEAQAQFQAALATPQYRDYVRTMLARGVCHARAGQWPDAEAALMRAYEVDPANPTTGFSLAEVLYRRQDFTRARFYIGRVNGDAEAVNAQSLWLALRIERKLGAAAAERVLADQLRKRFPQSPEAVLLEGGRFDD